VLLWKSGDNQRAIELLLGGANDVTTAVKLAQQANDPGLWKVIRDAVKGHERDMICDYLRIMDDPGSVLLTLGAGGQQAAGLLPLAQTILEKTKVDVRMRTLTKSLLESDWDINRFNGRSFARYGLAVDPKSTKCKVCGMRVCEPVGFHGDKDSQLDTYVDAPIYTQTKSALVVVSDIHGGPVHGSCLLRLGNN
jgi:hypothetical protein